MNFVSGWRLFRRSETGVERELPFLGSPEVVAVAIALGLAAWGITVAGGRYYLIVVGLAAAYLVSALGYTVVLGFAGQMAFAQAGFMAIGAYTYSLLHDRGVPGAIAFVAAAALAGVVAAPLAIAVMRTRVIYLALVTLAFAEAVKLLASRLSFTHGDDGVGVDLWGQRAAYLSIVGACLSLIVVHRIFRSYLGRAFVMIRSDEDAARALGVPIVATRVIAFVLSGVFGGIGGVFLAGVLRYISPANFSTDLTLMLLTMMVVGGLGSIWGTVIGVAVIVWVNERLSSALEIRSYAYGVILFVFLVAVPGGLVSIPALVDRGRRLVARALRSGWFPTIGGDRGIQGDENPL